MGEITLGLDLQFQFTYLTIQLLQMTHHARNLLISALNFPVF